MPSEGLLAGAKKRFVELLPEYNPQGVANSLWAFATLGHFPGKQPQRCVWNLC